MSTIALTHCSLVLPAGGDHILSDLSLTLPLGRITWLVGESGAGKSTLCNLLAGLTPTRAEVTGHLDMDSENFDDRRLGTSADGRKVTGIDLGTRRGRRQLARLRRRGELSWAPQNAMDTFPPRLRLREWFQRAGIETPDLTPFGLEATMLDRYPQELSGGQISRMSLAAALSHTPRLLVCDEPTAGLDPRQADSVVSILDDCARVGGSAVLAVTHDLSSMARNARLGDHVGVIFNGHIVESCTVETFLNETANNAYSRALAAAAPGAGAHPLPLTRDHLGGSSYQEGDELRRLGATHVRPAAHALPDDHTLPGADGALSMRGGDDGVA